MKLLCKLFIDHRVYPAVAVYGFAIVEVVVFLYFMTICVASSLYCFSHA